MLICGGVGLLFRGLGFNVRLCLSVKCYYCMLVLDCGGLLVSGDLFGCGLVVGVVGFGVLCVRSGCF